MQKVTAFIGSHQKQATFMAVQEFELYLKSKTEIDFEYVFLKDYQLEFCKGCKLCFNKGEEFCPLKDSRDLLIDKLNTSDGVIFASPNYAFQVSAQMKSFLDRLAFNLHRPCFFGKAFTAVIAQGIFGGSSIMKYLIAIGKGMGFHTSKGCCITALEPRTPKEQKKISQNIKKASERFYKELMRHTPPTPSLFMLMMFRLARNNINLLQDESFCDYRFYKENGWFESDYYYDTHLSLFKKLVGYLFDLLGSRKIKKR